MPFGKTRRDKILRLSFAACAMNFAIAMAASALGEAAVSSIASAACFSVTSLWLASSISKLP